MVSMDAIVISSVYSNSFSGIYKIIICIFYYPSINLSPFSCIFMIAIHIHNYS